LDEIIKIIEITHPFLKVAIGGKLHRIAHGIVCWISSYIDWKNYGWQDFSQIIHSTNE